MKTLIIAVGSIADVWAIWAIYKVNKTTQAIAADIAHMYADAHRGDSHAGHNH